MGAGYVYPITECICYVLPMFIVYPQNYRRFQVGNTEALYLTSNDIFLFITSGHIHI